MANYFEHYTQTPLFVHGVHNKIHRKWHQSNNYIEIAVLLT